VIGLGTDLVDVERFRRTLARTPSLVEKLFTDGEREYSERANDPTERYAVRFAAKEAAMKALGVGLGAIDWHDVEVVRTGSGAPTLRITGRAAELADAAGVQTWAISLSHTTTMAQAVVVAQ
jgi:holo-[acyl-carrier protein] synthase